MPRPILLLDMDGIVSQFVPAFLHVYARYGGVIPSHLALRWNFFEALPDQSAVKRTWDDPAIFLHQEPYHGAVDAVKHLHDAYQLMIVSTAPPPLDVHIPAKVRWVQRYLPWLSHKQLIFTDHKELIRGDVLIDDHIENVLGWLGTNDGGLGILINRPWNEAGRDAVTAAGGVCFPGELIDLVPRLKGTEWLRRG